MKLKLHITGHWKQMPLCRCKYQSLYNKNMNKTYFFNIDIQYLFMMCQPISYDIAIKRINLSKYE